MNLEQLLARAQEIESAIMNATAQLAALQGHKAETAHWIQKVQHSDSADETQVEQLAEPVAE